MAFLQGFHCLAVVYSLVALVSILHPANRSGWRPPPPWGIRAICVPYLGSVCEQISVQALFFPLQTSFVAASPAFRCQRVGTVLSSTFDLLYEGSVCIYIDDCACWLVTELSKSLPPSATMAAWPLRRHWVVARCCWNNSFSCVWYYTSYLYKVS